MLCLTSPTMKKLFSPRSSLDTARKSVSCTWLLSWYSSIIISSNVSRNSSAVFFAVSVSSSTRISSAKCSRSWKSTRFFVRLARANSSANCSVRRTSSCSIGSVFFNCSTICSGEQKKNCLQSFFTVSFPSSRRFFTSSSFSGSPSKPRLLASLPYLKFTSISYSSVNEESAAACS